MHNELLTKEKFVTIASLPEQRVYRTGDRVRWLPNGNIEFLGRIDDQVKLRGFRIEPGEIAYSLGRHTGINEAVVVVKEKQGDQFLVAYYVAQQPFDPVDLRDFLSRSLPAYMIPSFYVHLPHLPLHPNGKLNRSALPEPVAVKETGHLPPSNLMQEQIVGIWAEVLKIPADTISIHANFFEMGGHSINIVVLCRKINDLFHCTISVAQMFGLPTISSIEHFLTKGDHQRGKTDNGMEEAINEANNNLEILAGIMN